MPGRSAQPSRSRSTQSGANQRRRYAPRLPAEERREQLIDAALGVILTHGYEGVSVEAVARAAGVTRPVVYDHFQNLADLLQTLFAREERYSLEQLSRVLPEDAADRDPVELLMSGVSRLLEAVSERPETWRLILFPLQGTPAVVREHVEQNRARFLGRIEALVQRSVERGALPPDLDVELMARALRDVSEEAARMVLTDPERYTPARYASFVDSILKVLRAPGHS